MGGNGCNNHQPQQALCHRKSIFLPLLCSSSRHSTKDVVVVSSIPTTWEPHRSSSSSSSSSSSLDDPLSPQIGCMGQVKRSNKDKFNFGFPTSRRRLIMGSTAAAAAAGPVKYLKLARIFSGKNYITSKSSMNNSKSKSIVCSRRRGPKTVDDGKENSSECLNVLEMDPPLPVIRRKVKPTATPEVAESLWKRRSGGGGMALQSLKIQEIHHISRHRIEPTTV